MDNKVDWKEIHLVELFGKETDADSFAREISGEAEPEYWVSEASGNDILRIISLVDQVDIDGDLYAISHNGARFDGEEFLRPKPEKLIEIILSTTTPLPDQ